MFQPFIAFSEGHCWGLRQGHTVLLPAQYEAVWALPYGFWGFRQGVGFGVLAPDGREASACELPAVFPGFAQLTAEDELAAFLEAEGTFIPFVRQRFPQLHVHYGQLCQPVTWLAEDITPYLAEAAEGELWLPTATGSLVLKRAGTWQGLDFKAGTPTCYFAPQAPARPFEQANTAQFKRAEIAEILRWRLQHQELQADGIIPDAAVAFTLAVTNAQAEAAHYRATQELLTGSNIRPMGPVEGVDVPFYKAFDLAALTPAVRQACEAHINTIFEVDADSMVYVEQLIYLAWLWANGFVFFDPADEMHWVDDRYQFDNGWFDNHVIDYIYEEHELQKLAPLLRGAA